MFQGEPCKEVVFSRRSGTGNDVSPVRDDVLQGGIPVRLDATERVKRRFRGEITDVQQIIGLLEISHDPIYLGIERDRNDRRSRQKSKNRAVKAAGNQIVGLPQCDDKVPPRLDCRKVDLSFKAVLGFLVQALKNFRDHAFVIAE